MTEPCPRILIRAILWILVPLWLAGCSSIHWGAAKFCEPPPLSGDDAPRPGVLRIMSWNVHGTPDVGPMGERIARIASVARARRPDVLFLQEVWFRGDAELFEKGLGRDYRRADDKSLKVSEGFLRQLVGFRDGGLVTFIRSDRTKRVHSRFSPFENQCDGCPPFEGDALSNKGIQTTELMLGEQQVLLVNTHLQSQYPEKNPPKRYELLRQMQIAEIVRLVRATP